MIKKYINYRGSVGEVCQIELFSCIKLALGKGKKQKSMEFY